MSKHKFCVTGHAEFFTRAGFNPRVAASQFVLTATCYAFHDLGCASVEGEGAWQNHADRFFSAVGVADAVADALAVKVDVGLGGDGDV